MEAAFEASNLNGPIAILKSLPLLREDAGDFVDVLQKKREGHKNCFRRKHFFSGFIATLGPTSPLSLSIFGVYNNYVRELEREKVLEQSEQSSDLLPRQKVPCCPSIASSSLSLSLLVPFDKSRCQQKLTERGRTDLAAAAAGGDEEGRLRRDGKS